MVKNVSRPVLSAALLALGLAGAALAGGIDLRLEAAIKEVDKKSGLVTLDLSLEHRFGCYPSCFIEPEAGGTGPRVRLERRGKDAKGNETWVAVEAPWVFARRSPGPRPDGAPPFRLDEGTKLSFTRQARLEPGVYRVAVTLALHDGAERFEVGPYHSKELEVVAP
jgi:hypothetical protein